MPDLNAKVANNDSASTVESFVLIHVDSPQLEAKLVPGTLVQGAGWVICEREVVEVAVYLHDRFLGYATYGEARPEIAERFPHYLQSDASGFSFSLKLPDDVSTQTSAWLFVQVSMLGGAISRKGVPVDIIGREELAQLTTAASPSPSFGSIKVSVENARIDAGGILRVSGWLLSQAPLKTLELFLGEALLGAPETGISRPDVAQSYPEYDQSGNAGFRLVQDISEFKSERPVLRARVTGIGGIRRQVIVPVVLPEKQIGGIDPDSGLHLCLDSAAVRSDGSVLAEGWAVSAAGIQEVIVDLDGVYVGSTNVGGHRPDVGNRFPRIQGARRSGFSFTRRLDTTLRGEHLLSVRAKDSDGRERVIQMPMLVEEVSRSAEIAEHLAPDDEIRFDVDAPVLDGERAREPVRSVLTIAGWALSSNGIDKVEIFLDDQSIGNAYYGMRREDIAAAFPNIEGGLLSGYAITIPHRMLVEGDQNIRIVFKDKVGKIAERNFSIAVAESDETVTSTLLRDRVGQVEIDLSHRLLHNEHRPFFTLVIRSRGAEPAARDLLDQTIRSIREQSYQDWRVLVVPEGDESVPDLQTFLGNSRYKSPGPIRVAVYFDHAAHTLDPPSYSVKRRFVAAFRPGDVLGCDALFRFASEITRDNAIDLLYCDERREDPSSGKVSAFFKPRWSPELLDSTNYLGRAWVAAASLLKSSQIDLVDLAKISDYDSVLRLTENARKIHHLAQVLVDTEKGGGDTDEIVHMALADAMRRRQEDGEVLVGRAPATWRMRRRLKSDGKVSFIIPTCAARGLIKVCIETIRTKTHYQNYELIVLDNIPDSLPDDKRWVRENADKVLEIPEKFNWSRFNNLGVAKAEGEFLLFLNDDIEVLDEYWLENLLQQAERPNVGVVGAQLLYPDRKVQHAGIFLSGSHGRHAFRFSGADDPGYFGLALTERNMIAVTGACMLSRREAYDRVGGFDEAHSVVNNDLDYCLRMWRAGQRVVYTPFVSLIHHELASRATMSDVFDEDRFLGEWSGVFLHGDPYFNPNLSTDADEYAVETEPAEVVFAGHPMVRASNVESILAVKLDHIGDFITALPSFRRIKQRFPKAKLYVLASKASKALAAMEPAIDEFIEFDFFNVRSGLGRREITVEEWSVLRARLCEQRFDLAVDLRMQPDTRHVLQYTGAPVLAGFDHAGRFPWLQVALEWEGDTRFAPKRTSVVDRLMQLVEALAIACEADRSGVTPISSEEAWKALHTNPAMSELPAGFLDKPMVVVHPAVGSDTRQWPEEHFAGLIDLLVNDLDVHVFLIGSKDEMPIADTVLAKVQRPTAVQSLVGALSLRELPLLLQVASLYVGNNSGPKHLAAALGTPTIGVHSGVVDATEWGPYGPRAVAIRRKTVCSPCYIAAASDCHRNLACLRKLRPSDVFEVCKMMLDESAHADQREKVERDSVVSG